MLCSPLVLPDMTDMVWISSPCICHYLMPYSERESIYIRKKSIKFSIYSLNNTNTIVVMLIMKPKLMMLRCTVIMKTFLIISCLITVCYLQTQFLSELSVQQCERNKKECQGSVRKSTAFKEMIICEKSQGNKMYQTGEREM